MVTATIVRRWRRPLSAVALRRIAAEERHCVIVITPTHVEAHRPARCITAAALFGGAPPTAWVETTRGIQQTPPTDRAAAVGMSGGAVRGSLSPCGRCGGDASDRRAVTGEALHPLRTLPHPAPPPWLHDQIIATIASEAERRRAR